MLNIQEAGQNEEIMSSKLFFFLKKRSKNKKFQKDLNNNSLKTGYRLHSKSKLSKAEQS